MTDRKPSFTNPIYGENQDNNKTIEEEKLPEHYFPEDRKPPVDRLLQLTGDVDVVYNVHSAIDRVLKSVEDTDSGDETSNLIANNDGNKQCKTPIDRTIASIRNDTELNAHHPIDRLYVSASHDSDEFSFPAIKRIEKTLQQESPVNLKKPIDRLGAEPSTPKSVERLYKTLCADAGETPAASSKPIDKLMRSALSDNNASHANPTNPLDRLITTAVHTESQYDNRKPIDRLTQSLTGKNIPSDESINTAGPLARLERTLTSK